MMTGQRKIISPNPKRGEYHRWSVGGWREQVEWGGNSATSPGRGPSVIRVGGWQSALT